MSALPLNSKPIEKFTEKFGPQKEAGEIPALDSSEAKRFPSWMVYLVQSLDEEEARRMALSG